MCKFITLIIQPKIEIEKFKNIFSTHNFNSSSVENQSIRQQYGKDANIIFPTKAHCDCGSVIGIPSNNLSEEEKQQRLHKQIDKLKKKGWSNIKIERWLQERYKDNKQENRELEKKEECNNWIAFFKRLLADKNVKQVSILAHWYHSDILTETITLKESIKIKADDLNVTVLSNLLYDTPLTIIQ